MSFASQFIASGEPVGATRRGIRLPDPKWLMCDGRAVLRDTYPLLSLKFPIGKYTGTARTLAAIPATPQVDVMGTTLVAAGVSGTSSVQSSTNNGASWAAVATGLSVTPASLAVADGYVYVLNAAAAQGMVSGKNNLAGWQALSLGPTSVVAGTSMSRIVWAPNLLLGANGTVFFIPSASGNVVYAVAPGSIALNGGMTIGETSAKQAGCWTGNRLLILKAGSANMLDLRWSAPSIGSLNLTATNTIVLPEAIASGQGNIASDGNGTVVITGVASGILVSTDHGDNFIPVIVSGVVPSDQWRVQRAGDRFIIPTVQGVLSSLDGKAWQLDTQPNQNFLVAAGVAKVSGVIMQVSAATAAYSMTESTTEFNLPFLRNYSWSVAGTNTPQEPTFIKAR